MPVFIVSEFSELILRNLIAYEQTNFVLNHITSYVFALNKLVDTEDDVAKLVHSRVLVNNMGSNEEAAAMINIIRKELLCGQFFYGQQWKTLNKHYSSSWRKQRAWVKRTYFSGPWSAIALLAAIVMFVLALIQTIFTVLSVGSN
ncbi:hypothetical protein HanPI659440_Chr13g0501501 [Helianthus annuus]|nr:hypothetical protein HanPI659440_Chr13g0501501 [Helianthus annuus]